MSGLLSAVAFGFAGASVYRVASIWTDLPDHVASKQRPGQPEHLLVQVFRYLLLIGLAWTGAGFVLLGDAMAAPTDQGLDGAPRVVALFGVVVLAISIGLMITVRLFGWPRQVVPPTVRRDSRR